MDEMRAAYFEKTGENPDMYSTLGKALQAAASELLSLYVYSDFVLREAFPQTAEGEWLERHAALRRLSRKEAACAEGTLTFSLAAPVLEEVTVPAGTVCAVADKPFVQFSTTEAAQIAMGETSVTVSAVATEPGEDGNAAAGTVTVMVNPPAGVYAVTNETAFAGGCDAESDMALRRRIMDAYRLPQTGYSAASLRESLMAISFMQDCVVQLSQNTIRVYARTVGNISTATLLAAVRERLALTKVSPYQLSIYTASRRPISLTLTVETEQEDPAVAEKVEKAVRDYCASVRLGENISLAKINCLCAGVDGVRYCDAASPDALDGMIFGTADAYFALTDLQVVCHV